MKHYLALFVLFSIVTAITAHETPASREIQFDNLEDAASELVIAITFEDLFNKAAQYLHQREYDKAIEYYQKAITKNPMHHQPYYNIGLIYEEIGNIDKAIEYYKDAILKNLNYLKAHLALAQLLQKKELRDEALIHFKKVLELDPKNHNAALAAAHILHHQEKFKESVPYFAIAAKTNPDDIMVSFEYANALNTCNQTQEALDIYFKLLEKRPNDSGILYNTAYTLKKLNRIQEAMPYYSAALKKNPNHAEAHFSLGLAYLTMGDFDQGWPEYEWRWQRNPQLEPRNFSQQKWNPSISLQGKTILLHAEQGLGDTCQFIRYAQVIKEEYKPAKLIVAVQKPLFTMIGKCCPYIDNVVTLNAIPTQFDYHIPLMTLPLLLKSNEQTIPRKIPYIFPDVTLTEFWRRRLASDTNFKVGICWQGNNKYSTPFLRAVVAAKSMPMNKFASLAHIDGVTLYSLQKETGTDQLNVKEFNLKKEYFNKNI